MSFCRAQFLLSSSTGYCKTKWFNISLNVTIELSPTSECIFSLLFITFLYRFDSRQKYISDFRISETYCNACASNTIDCLLLILK